MNAAELREVVNRAEANYEKAFLILSSVKEFKPASDLPQFQPLLARTMLELSNAYRQLSQKRKALIRKKASVKQEWFVAQLRMVQRRQEIVQSAIAIGQALGDSFAWFFYQRDPDLLEKHREQQRQDRLPPGIGGLGERVFIDHTQLMGNSLVLYHGVTTILRLGDFSLIDMSTLRVCGIGEIKTSRADDTGCCLSVSMLVRKDSNHGLPVDGPAVVDGPAPLVTAAEDFTPMSQHQSERMERQLAAIAESVKPSAVETRDLEAKLNPGKSLEALAHVLTTAEEEGQGAKAVGKGLIFTAYKLPQGSLYDRLTPKRKPNLKNLFEKIPSEVERITLPEAEKNSLEISTFLHHGNGRYALPWGTVPFFWWQLPQTAIRRVMLVEMVVLTMFNVGMFVALLEAEGFEVKYADGKKFEIVEISKAGESHRIEVRGMRYFTDLIRSGLYSELEVFDLIKQTLALAPTDDPTQRVVMPVRLSPRWGPTLPLLARKTDAMSPLE